MEIHGGLRSYLFARKILKSYLVALVFSSSLSIGKVIPIKVLNQDVADKLLVIGNVVFSQGEIFSCDNLKVVNEKNVEVPSRISNVVLWPDKSIMLATIKFVAEPKKDKFYFINYADNILRTNELKNDDTKELIKTNFIMSNDIENRSVSVMVDVNKTANLKYYIYTFCIVFILTVLILRKILLRK